MDYFATLGIERGIELWKNRKNFNLKGSIYKWKHNGISSNQLDDMLRQIFLTVSKNLEIYHWISTSVDLIRHMSKGKSIGDFVKYLKAFNQMCIEDLARKGSSYSSKYHKSFKHIINYLV